MKDYRDDNVEAMPRERSPMVERVHILEKRLATLEETVQDMRDMLERFMKQVAVELQL